jgi:hypothetical protein
MHGDFSRITFDPAKHFSRVLMQQGRVQLDADWNEQSEILLHYMRTLARDLIGPHGGPAGVDEYGRTLSGFEVLTRTQIEALEGSPTAPQHLVRHALSEPVPCLLGPGRYYVDGILCELESYTSFSRQPDSPYEDALNDAKIYLIYLDVWERHLTAEEDERIAEIALKGCDTTTRVKVVWQARAMEITLQDLNDNDWDGLLAKLRPAHRGSLSAWVRVGRSYHDASIVAPQSQYRGPENQLYRVEIHSGSLDGPPTFKWSRDNGAVVFPIRALSGREADLADVRRDFGRSLRPGDWVEILDDHKVLRGKPGVLARIRTVESGGRRVTLVPVGEPPVYEEKSLGHPILRRWDYAGRVGHDGEPQAGNDGALLLQESRDLALEQGIVIRFENGSGTTAEYRTGDYWLIPARTASGNVEWPRDGAGTPIPRPPEGIRHRYAPLAAVRMGDLAYDCRRLFPPVPE